MKGPEHCETDQSALSTVERMSVVASELGVSTLERGISVCLGLLDAVIHILAPFSVLLLFLVIAVFVRRVGRVEEVFGME